METKEKISKSEIKILKEMEGEEMISISNESVIGIEYPYIYKNGMKIKLNSEQWKVVYNEFWDDPSNEGYWLKKEMEEEFS